MAKVPINPVYPVASVASVDELMDIAVAVESEAARRYEQLAARLTRAGETEMAALFTELAGLERAHERGLSSWARREGRRQPVSPAFPWQLPETFGTDDEEQAVEPFRALAIAVRNEERAFAFYTYLAATCSEDAELRARAESLAREELEHVARLRAWRRRAWHSRSPAAARPVPVVRTVDDLHRLAAGLEAGQVDMLLAVAERATDETVLAEAQRLAHEAIGRLALIHTQLPEDTD
ncbi:MAG: ferritin family protein [Actinomycetota bacterium]